MHNYLGKMEERTPYISIRYPDWFQKKYPAAMQALKENSNILTTPFDIHETLLESLSYTPEKEYRIKPPLKQRMSLISPIDKYRTCESVSMCLVLMYVLFLIKSNITNSILRFI